MCACVCVWACVYVHACVCVPACLHASMCMCRHDMMCACMRVHAVIYILNIQRCKNIPMLATLLWHHCKFWLCSKISLLYRIVAVSSFFGCANEANDVGGKCFMNWWLMFWSVTQWVRRGACPWPSELISNVGGRGFESCPERWIFSSNMSYRLVCRLSGFFSDYSSLLPLPHKPSKWNLIANSVIA